MMDGFFLPQFFLDPVISASTWGKFSSVCVRVRVCVCMSASACVCAWVRVCVFGVGMGINGFEKQKNSILWPMPSIKMFISFSMLLINSFLEKGMLFFLFLNNIRFFWLSWSAECTGIWKQDYLKLFNIS